MPVAVSYPGVYIEEIPSGVRTITGVATSITAFIGRAYSGPIDVPVTINSFGDFERSFGKLHPDYPLSYAVRDFYQNGGAQAVVVRLYKLTVDPAPASPPNMKPARATIRIARLDLQAASEGTWGNSLRARIDFAVSADVAARMGLTAADLFNLTVRDMATGTTERIVNLTVKESPRRADRVLAIESSLVRVAKTVTLPGTAVPSAHPAPPAGKTAFEDDAASTKVATTDLAVDSAPLDAAAYLGDANAKTGMNALQKTDLFNLLCIPADTRAGDTPIPVWQGALTFCVQRRAMLIIDAPAAWQGAGTVTANNNKALTDLGLSGDAARNAALYFPRVIAADPNRQGQLDTFVPCGCVAGVMARTDAQRGIWKAPAGIDAAVNGTQGLAASLTNDENGLLNPLGVNCLRTFPIIGSVVWGARTLRGADLLADEYKYVPVRRLALYIEESLFRGTQWVVFEPNDEPLWSQIRLNVGAFMQNLFRQGAFQGTTPSAAYFVKCDKETTTQDDINRGVVNVVVGFAPLKPAEFVIIKIQQMAGQLAA